MNKIENNSQSLAAIIPNRNRLFEDIHFSIFVLHMLGMWLYIKHNAQLENHRCHINRNTPGVGQKRKFQECIKFYRKLKKNAFGILSLFWLLISLLFDSCAKVILTSSWMLLMGCFQKSNEGFK